MRHITARSAGEAWMKASRAVYSGGRLIKDGEQTLKELLNVFLYVEHPLEHDRVLEAYADPAMIKWMQDNFLTQKPVLNWGYSYGQRFFNYEGIDQITNVIEKLKKNPESKSATVSLMNPKGDGSHMPCIVAIDFKIRDGRLITTTFFRSQDVGKKIYADIICIGEIAKRVADAVGVNHGPLCILIASLHAYEADWNRVEDLLVSHV